MISGQEVWTQDYSGSGRTALSLWITRSLQDLRIWYREMDDAWNWRTTGLIRWVVIIIIISIIFYGAFFILIYSDDFTRHNIPVWTDIIVPFSFEQDCLLLENSIEKVRFILHPSEKFLVDFWNRSLNACNKGLVISNLMNSTGHIIHWYVIRVWNISLLRWYNITTYAS